MTVALTASPMRRLSLFDTARSVPLCQDPETSSASASDPHPGPADRDLLTQQDPLANFIIATGAPCTVRRVVESASEEAG